MSRMHVLLVDDGEGLMFILAQQLILKGHLADTVDGWARAVERVRQQPYDAVVVNTIPGPSSISVLRLIHKQRPHMPVLFYTSHGLSMAQEAPIGEGVHGYLPRSENLEILINEMMDGVRTLKA